MNVHAVKDAASHDASALRSSIDDIIDVYKKDVDRGMLRCNLRLTPTERLERFAMIFDQFMEMHEAGRRSRGEV